VCYFLGPLFTDWAPGFYVRFGCIGSPVTISVLLHIYCYFVTSTHLQLNVLLLLKSTQLILYHSPEVL